MFCYIIFKFINIKIINNKLLECVNFITKRLKVKQIYKIKYKKKFFYRFNQRSCNFT